MNSSLLLFFVLNVIFVTVAIPQQPETDSQNGQEGQASRPGESQPCSRFAKSIMRKFFLMLTGSYGDDGKQESQSKCWFNCVLTKIGVMGNKENMSYEASSEEMNYPANEEKKQQLAASIEMCSGASKTVSDPCDRSYMFVNCMHDNAQKANGNNEAEGELTA